MRINVHAGHNPDGKAACGAVGFIKESTESRNVKNEVIRLLKVLGHEVYDCTVENGTDSKDVLVNIVAKCNSHDVDLDVSIHFNAGANDASGNGKTTGVEALIYSNGSAAKEYAKSICDSVAELGFKNRGAKVNPNLYVLRKTKAPAILIECCFLDDKDDVALYDYRSMAAAIVYGITGEKYTCPVQNAKENALYRVQVGAYSVKGNAEKMKETLKLNGYDAVIVKS